MDEVKAGLPSFFGVRLRNRGRGFLLSRLPKAPGGLGLDSRLARDSLPRHKPKKADRQREKN